MNNFTFTPHSDGSIQIPASGLEISIDKASKKLIVESSAHHSSSFELANGSGPVEQAIHCTDDGFFQVGTVDYQGAPQFVRDFPLTNPNKDYFCTFKTNAGGGWVGSLDIRDIGAAYIEYEFHIGVVPALLFIDGDYLKVCTIRQGQDTDQAAAYTINPAP